MGRGNGSVCGCVSRAGFIGDDNGADRDCGEGAVCDWLINPRRGGRGGEVIVCVVVLC